MQLYYQCTECCLCAPIEGKWALCEALPITSVHVTPESLEVQMLSAAEGPEVAVCFDPSLDIAMLHHSLLEPRAVHVAPESVET